MLGAGRWELGAGWWVLGAGLWELGAGSWRKFVHNIYLMKSLLGNRIWSRKDIQNMYDNYE